MRLVVALQGGGGKALPLGPCPLGGWLGQAPSGSLPGEAAAAPPLSQGVGQPLVGRQQNSLGCRRWAQLSCRRPSAMPQSMPASP